MCFDICLNFLKMFFRFSCVWLVIGKINIFLKKNFYIKIDHFLEKKILQSEHFVIISHNNKITKKYFFRKIFLEKFRQMSLRELFNPFWSKLFCDKQTKAKFTQILLFSYLLWLNLHRLSCLNWKFGWIFSLNCSNFM